MVAEKLACFRSWKFTDKKSGVKIAIKRTPDYSILEINGRSYYFHPETGEFDGLSEDIKGN